MPSLLKLNSQSAKMSLRQSSGYLEDGHVHGKQEQDEVFDLTDHMEKNDPLVPTHENEAFATQEAVTGKDQRLMLPRDNKTPQHPAAALGSSQKSQKPLHSYEQARGGDRTLSPGAQRGSKPIAMEDLDLTQSSEAASEYDKLPYPDYEKTLVLIEHLRMECKDSRSLLKIQDTVHSYKTFMKLKNSYCEVLLEKHKTMENKVSELHKKLSEMEHKKMDQEQELCNLRFALKQEVEKRKNAEWVYEKIKVQLKEKEEQYNKEVELKQQLEIRVRELHVELKSLRNEATQTLEERNDTQKQLQQEYNARVLQDKSLMSHLQKQKELQMAQEKISSELQEALDQRTKSALCAKKMQDCIQRLGLENYKLKVTVTNQAEKIEQLKENLVNENVNDDLTTKLETASSKCLHLHKENQLLQQELLSMKSTKKKCEKLRKHKKKLEQEIVYLKSHMEKNMLECGQVEQYKCEIEEKIKQDLGEKLKQVNIILQIQAAYEEQLQELRNKQNASIRSQMELRIRDLESELSKMKSQVDCNKIEMENYKHLYLEEVRIRKSLSNKLSKTDERLAEVKTQLLLERRQNRPSQYSTPSKSPALASICPRDLSERFFIPRSVSRENLVFPTSNLWHSIETMPDCKTEVLLNLNLGSLELLS